jgi:hypothetical protein
VISIAPVRRQAVISHPLVPEHSLSTANKVLIWASCVVGIFVSLNLASFVIFRFYTMPFTKIQGRNVGLMSYSALENDVNKRLATEKVTVAYNGKTLDLTYNELGLTFDSERTFNLANKRTIWNIPLVQLAMNSSMQITPLYNVDQPKLESALSKVITEVNKPAKDAKLIFPDTATGDFKVTDAVSGQLMNTKVAAEQFLSKLETASYSATEIKLSPENVAPAASKADLEGKIEDARALLNEPITITDQKGNKITTIEPENFIRLMGSEGKEIAAEPELLKVYVHEELSEYFYTAPVTRRVNGGVLTEAGKNGIGLDEAHAIEMLKSALVDADVRQVALKSRIIKTPEVVDGVYPQTDEGLAALLRDFDDSRYGQYNLIVRQMKDGGLGASHGAIDQIIPASTYKAFIAYAALKSIERGEFTLDTMTPHGTVRDCMYEMIHVSTDHCAISIQDYMGWQKVDDLIHEAGFVNTFINNQGWGGEKYTTALDEYRLIRGLYDGALLNKEHTNHLLDLMKNQMWRNGIPAGSAPSTVANKVGFYALRENDVGIVYAPKGDYIIIAMSYKGSFGEIAQLSRQVYQYFGN